MDHHTLNRMQARNQFRFRGLLALLVVALTTFGGYAYFKATHAAGLNIGIAAAPIPGPVWHTDTDGCVTPGTCLGAHNGTIVGIASNNNGGYWLAGTDGGIYSYGGAVFQGSLPGRGVTVSNIRAIAAGPGGGGYWLVSTNGNVYAFGGVAYYGNATGSGNNDFVGIASDNTGHGYWLVESNGKVWAFGDAGGGSPSTGAGAVGIAGSWAFNGAWVLRSNGGVTAIGDPRVVNPPPLAGSFVAVSRYGNNSSNCIVGLQTNAVISVTCPVPNSTTSVGSSAIGYGASTTISWNSSSATSCSGNGFNTGGSISNTVSTGALTSQHSYSVTCSNAAYSALSNTQTVLVGAYISNFSADSTSLPNNGSTTLHWTALNASSCSISPGGATGLSGNWTTPALTSPTNYTLSCAGINGAGGYAKTIGISVAGKAPAPPAGGGGGSTIGGGTPAPGGGTIGPSGGKVPGHPNLPPDTSPPSMPGDFTAQLNDQVVGLAWTASTDNNGIDHYTLERSLDQSVWTMLSEHVTDTNYTDTTVGYGTTYYYRLKAFDLAGNSSDFATAQVTTGAFSPNSSGGQPTVVTSDDNIVTVTIPTNALSDAADCSIVTDSDNASSLPLKKAALITGPYNLLCKKSDATFITNFSSPVSVEVKLKADQLKRYKGFTFYQYNSDKSNWSKFKVSYNKKTKVYSFNVTTAVQFAVLGQVKKGLSAQTIILIIMFILALGGIGYYLYQRAQKANYQEYIRKKYYNL